MKWHFTGLKPSEDNHTWVEASSEEDARHLAMTRRWGPLPDPALGIFGTYKGRGLHLVETR